MILCAFGIIYLETGGKMCFIIIIKANGIVTKNISIKCSYYFCFNHSSETLTLINLTNIKHISNSLVTILV